MTNEDLQQIQNLVTSARKVLVLTHGNPSVDTMASTLALYLALLKLGKNVTVAMETPPLVEVSNLVGIDKVQTSLGGGTGGNLLITYKPYQLGDFEKVAYLEDQATSGPAGDSFKLTITPRSGYFPDPKNFQFSFTGSPAGNFDLILTVEILEPTQAGKLYDQQLFASAQIINIDNHDPNKDYGRFNLVEPDAASISEIVTFFLRAINAQIDTDIANNLYQGIVQASNNFQNPKVAAATFEAAAICLRAKTSGKQGTGNSQNQPAQPFDQAQGKQQNVNPSSVTSQQQFQSVPVSNVQPVPPQATPEVVRPTGEATAATRDTGEIPKDWTQPKSYRGTSVV